MCCFAKSIQSVSNTNLFARLSGKGTQFLVYQMRYESAVPNAMILPLPIALPAREDSVRFVSFEKYDRFFDDLSLGFPSDSIPTRRVDSKAINSAAAKQLVVHDVGQFVASFVPSQADFDRLDSQFVIAKESWDKIPEYADYGFVVFQLKELVGKPHPMAMEFETRLPGQLFYPTVHIHDGEVHEQEQFDHVLYAQDPAFDKATGNYVGPSTINAPTGWVRSKGLAKEFSKTGLALGFVERDLLVHRIAIQGRQPNRDIIKPNTLHLLSHSNRNKSNSNFTFLGPAVLAITGLSWLVGRRIKLAKRSD